MEKIDIAIIGAGVIGLAVGREIANKDRDVFIFEKYKSFGQETSSRNSEVIHSGIYYPENTIKTKTCIDGNSMLYDIAAKNAIPHKRIGKLIVAVEEDELFDLQKLYERGKEKDLEGIKLLSAKEVNALEPNIKAIEGILLPTTGIIDTHLLMEYYVHEVKNNCGDIIYDAEVTAIEFTGNDYIVTTRSGNHDSVFSAKAVINCAGLESDIISSKVGIKEYVLHYCKGDYFRVGNGKNRLVERLVYPVVKENDVSLGIHITPDMAGGVRLGPDAEYVGSRDKNYDVKVSKRKDFLNDVKRFAPFLSKEDLSVDTSGIRPKIQGPGEGFRDFTIIHEAEKGFPGFINLIGIESPGLTASPAIAKIVGEMVQGLL